MKKFLAAVMALCLCAMPLFAAHAESSGAYVLMNIPYDKFYEAEVDGAYAVDAVSSSTMMKTRNGGLAGGSYHVNADGSDISGVIFPVYVDDLSALAELGGVEITDESSVSITVTLKGEESTTVYEGSEALFEAPSYSYYVLDGEPAQFKTLTIGDEPSFSALSAEPEAVEAEASFVYDKHTELTINVKGLDDVLADATVSGVVLAAEAGTKVGLRHVVDIWRKTALGFNLDSAAYAALNGKTISQITFITPDASYAVAVNLYVPENELMAHLSGTYIELFPEFAKEEYKDFWMETFADYGIEGDDAEMYYSMLTDSFMGRLYGQEAIDAYGADPESMLFDCYFENGIAKITINGNVISGVDEEGNELFRHAYSYLEDQTVTYFGMEMPVALHIYKTDDEDAGLFTYFAFSDDTLGETQHLEFRYSATLENIANYTEGDCAYWMASATQDGYKDSLLKSCIQLFVSENVAEEEEAAG